MSIKKHPVENSPLRLKLQLGQTKNRITKGNCEYLKFTTCIITLTSLNVTQESKRDQIEDITYQQTL